MGGGDDLVLCGLTDLSLTFKYQYEIILLEKRADRTTQYTNNFFYDFSQKILIFILLPLTINISLG